MNLFYFVRSFRFLVVSTVLLLTISSQSAAQTVFTVSNTANTGVGSLRQAILDLNASAAANPYEIRFIIGAAGSLQAVNVTATLADINKSDVLITGLTQGVSVCAPLITINFGGVARGFRTSSGMNNISIVGLILQNCDRAIHFQDGAGHSVKGCYFGLLSNGLTLSPVTATPFDAITIDGASTCTIGGPNFCDRNIICNYRDGISFLNAGTGHSILNNFIGLAKDGATVRGNSRDGIRVAGTMTNVTIGALGGFNRNIISGNAECGINLVNTDNADCSIINNYIGLDSTGMLSRSNGTSATAGTYCGIIANGDNTIVQSNVIGGDGATYNNYMYQIYFEDGNNHQLLDNIIGLDRTGVANATNFGSYDDGVRYTSLATVSGLIITGNIICNSGNGQVLSASAPNAGRGIAFMDDVANVTIKNNKFGVDITGNTAKGNYEHGIFFNNDGLNVIVGGTDAERNYFGGNGYRAGSTAQLRHGMGAVTTGALSNFLITNNYFGLGADGVTNVGNANFGMGLQGLVSSVISYNFSWYNRVGLFLATSGTSAANGNTINNNNFSYNNDPLLNSAGIQFQQGCNYNKIINNTITYNKQGIWLRARTPPSTGGNNDNNIIRGNNIGFNTGGGSSAPYTALEAFGNGIVLSGDSDRNYIGGPLAVHDNLIHDNGGNGILIMDATSTENKIRRNSIYCNGAKGIDLNGAGNANKAHPGPYLVITVPVVQATSGGNLATDTVEVFYDNACGDCEGRTYLGYATVTAAGQWSFSGVPDDQNITVRGTANTNAAYANSSEFSSCVGDPLPVSLIFFKAYKQGGNSVKVIWATASEENNSHFNLERSIDGISWNTITRVQGKGTTSFFTEYNFLDENVGKGIVYYRLIQVDHDNTETKSPVESLSFDSDIKILIFPNPFSDYVKIVPVKALDGEIEVELFEVTGKLIYSGSFDGSSAEIKIGGQLSQGMYLIKLKFENTQEIVKLLKDR